MAVCEIVAWKEPFKPTFLETEAAGNSGWLCLLLPPHLRWDLMVNTLRGPACPCSCIEMDVWAIISKKWMQLQISQEAVPWHSFLCLHATTASHVTWCGGVCLKPQCNTAAAGPQLIVTSFYFLFQIHKITVIEIGKALSDHQMFPQHCWGHH